MGFSHPLDASAIVDDDAHAIALETEVVARQFAVSLTKATGKPWTADPFDEDACRLERPPRTAHLIYDHRIVRERDGFPCKVLSQIGRATYHLAFVLEGQDYDDAFHGTFHVRPRPLGPIDVALATAQFLGDPSDIVLRRFLRHADEVWSRVLDRRAAREPQQE